MMDGFKLLRNAVVQLSHGPEFFKDSFFELSDFDKLNLAYAAVTALQLSCGENGRTVIERLLHDEGVACLQQQGIVEREWTDGNE